MRPGEVDLRKACYRAAAGIAGFCVLGRTRSVSKGHFVQFGVLINAFASGCSNDVESGDRRECTKAVKQSSTVGDNDVGNRLGNLTRERHLPISTAFHDGLLTISGVDFESLESTSFSDAISSEARHWRFTSFGFRARGKGQLKLLSSNQRTLKGSVFMQEPRALRRDLRRAAWQ